jgi:hypothetical protein
MVSPLGSLSPAVSWSSRDRRWRIRGSHGRRRDRHPRCRTPTGRQRASAKRFRVLPHGHRIGFQPARAAHASRRIRLAADRHRLAGASGSLSDPRLVCCPPERPALNPERGRERMHLIPLRGLTIVSRPGRDRFHIQVSQAVPADARPSSEHPSCSLPASFTGPGLPHRQRRRALVGVDVRQVPLSRASELQAQVGRRLSVRPIHEAGRRSTA